MSHFYKKYFCIPKYEKVTEKVFLARTMLSVLSMLVCLIILCSGTLAYFNAMSSSDVNPIKAATYDLAITPGEGITAETNKTYTCAGNSNHIYTFTLAASGNAEKGYCKIYLDGDTNSPYFTDQIDRSSITVQIKAADGTKVRFEPCWGTSSVSASGGATYGADDVIVCASAENLTNSSMETDDYILHTVAESDTLASIAEKYQTPVAAICEYNEIAEDTVLTAGQQIAIPKNFTIEEDPAEETTAADPTAGTDGTEEDSSSEPTEPIDTGSSVETNTGETEPPATTESTTETDAEATDATTEPTESSEPEPTTDPEYVSEPETTESTSEPSSAPDTNIE